MKIKFIKVLLLVILLSLAVFYTGNDILIKFENDRPSISKGTTSNGNLKYGKRLPSKGKNYRTYSYFGALLGRNSVHSKVRDVVVNTYNVLNKKYPDRKYVYGETGWPNGGNFKPHLTHENGLSVDFMVPIRSNKDEIIYIPTSIFNKFGYGIDFNNKGAAKNYMIDFEAMALHIYYLYLETLKEPEIEIRRVIFDPVLQPYLFKTKYGAKLKQYLKFSSRRSWVRHDEHYHIDFKIN